MLYQSIGRSTCALSATANLLMLYGILLGREEARQLFGYSKCGSVRAVTHPMLQRTMERQLGYKSLRWKRCSALSFNRLHRALKVTLASRRPALVTFHIRHRSRDWFGVHCAVAIDIEDNGVHLLDSLGRRDGYWPNATLTSAESPPGWRMAGAPYFVTRGPFRILDGLPPLSEERLSVK
jgi:hypothetical protein